MTSRQNDHVSQIVIEGTELRYEKLSLVLDVEELSVLHPHEETLTYGVDKLEAMMRKDGMQIGDGRLSMASHLRPESCFHRVIL